MPLGLGDSKELRFYMALAQVGVEFVAPLVVGVLLDLKFDWQPWGTILGGLLGFVGGMYHLVTLANRPKPNDQAGPREGPP